MDVMVSVAHFFRDVKKLVKQHGVDIEVYCATDSLFPTSDICCTMIVMLHPLSIMYRVVETLF